MQLEEPVVEQLAYTAAGHLNPMAAMMGGIVGQVGRLQDKKPLWHPVVEQVAHTAAGVTKPLAAMVCRVLGQIGNPLPLCPNCGGPVVHQMQLATMMGSKLPEHCVRCLPS